MASILEQYRISDFVEWNEKKQLRINRDFQRGSVWTPAARTYLIDSILRGYPIPKIYLRTIVDTKTKRSMREVVDGQQRVQAILAFANDDLVLGPRAEEFAGKRYSQLDDEMQRGFLSYAIAVDQLLNAGLDEVLEVFARLNSYSVSLNAPEKRHARFQGDFKWAVRKSSTKWHSLIEKSQVLTVREMVRMMDDSLMAEMYRTLMEGVCDGGQPKLDRLYVRGDSEPLSFRGIPDKVDHVLSYFEEILLVHLSGLPVLRSPHFLMLFSALAHTLYGIPEGEMGDAMPRRTYTSVRDPQQASENLRLLAALMDADEPAPAFMEFWKASRSSTQRISSRRIRFPFYYRALHTRLG